MQIASNSNVIGTGNATSISPRLEHDHQLQSVFTAVLATVGREGYKSADELPADSGPLEEQMTSNWESWFAMTPSRYSDYLSTSPNSRLKTAEQFEQDFSNIMVDAYRHGGYASPQKYLQSLDREQLHTVQQVHRLADPIDPTPLSEEAALNLLLPPSAVVDANKDGLVAIGRAYTIGFPDSETPREVRDAWEATTAGMPEQDVAIHVLQAKMSLMLANMNFDREGNYLGSNEPGSEQWVNPANSSSFSYRDMAQQWLDYLDAFRSKMQPEHYDRDHAFWSELFNRLPSA